jgi:membrane associated rhomboid family serine protease
LIPIRDTIRSETYPIVTYTLIAINALVFFIEQLQGRNLNEFIFTYGLVPARYSLPEISAYFTTSQQIVAFITFMFVHGGFFHILGNMWFLHIFGDNVEDRLGHFRYLGFYLLCGLASGISHLFLNWTSQIPTVGASGAIAGVMGAYFILYPRAKVLTLVPIFFFLHFMEIPAYIFLGLWIFFQFLNATAYAGQVGGIAWWAHIGGFIFGIIFLKFFQYLPEMGIEQKFRHLTKKHKSPRLQIIRPVSMGDKKNLYNTITLSEREAAYGTRKLINIADGHKEKTFVLTIPPGISDGSNLRLKGMGLRTSEGEHGDLLLKVNISD